MRLAPCLLLAALLGTPALASPPDYGALDIHALLNALTDDQRARFHIAQAYWVTADDDVAIDFAYLLGDRDGIATYNPNGSLITEGLTQIPTSWLLRVPQPWNGRLIGVIPGGEVPHNRFFDYSKRLLERGFAVVTMNHPSPGFAGFPFESFSERPNALGDAYFSCTHRIKDLLSEAFARASFAILFGESHGSGRGGGLIVGRPGNPVDGYVLFTAGAGRKDRVERWLAVLSAAVNGTGENVIDLTGQPPGIPLPLDEELETLLGSTRRSRSLGSGQASGLPCCQDRAGPTCGGSSVSCSTRRDWPYPPGRWRPRPPAATETSAVP